MTKSLSKTKLLLVEGNDEVVFFDELFKYIGMSNSVDVVEVGGKDQFKIKMPILKKTTGFNSIEVIGIIRDADESCENTYESIKGVLKKIGLPAAQGMGNFTDGLPRVGIFILPDNKNGGMLENLCLDTVHDDESMDCVEQFIQCSAKLKKHPKNIAKAKAQAFMATRPQISNSVGRGAQKGYWNFASVKIKPLISFLEQFR